MKNKSDGSEGVIGCLAFLFLGVIVMPIFGMWMMGLGLKNNDKGAAVVGGIITIIGIILFCISFK